MAQTIILLDQEGLPSDLNYRVAFWLDVPMARQRFYANAAAVSLSQALMRRGYYVPAIRPPTVPAGGARLRVTLSAAHTEAQVDALLDALGAERRA